jgi:hypothetical protein
MSIAQFNLDEFKNTINFSDIKGKSVVMCIYEDSVLYWVHSLTYKKKFVCLHDNWMIYYSEIYDLYFFYFIKDFGIESTTNPKFLTGIKSIQESNKVHFVLTFTKSATDLLEHFEQTKYLPNVKYSILNYNSEIFREDHPFNLNDYKNISYLFSCTNLLKAEDDDSPNWLEKNPHKFKLDFKYPMIYFYHKLGFNYFQKGEQQIEIKNRLSKIFLYSKVASKGLNSRYQNIQLAMETNRIYQKEYSEEDWFWYFANYNHYHTPFVIDYNMCKFNLVMETNYILRRSEGDDSSSNNFFSEKTLKALMVSTPSYVLLRNETYQSLKDYGFYLLNEEFQVLNDEYFSYQAFCNFMKNCNDLEFDNLFNQSFKRSKMNKQLVEEYIYSDKKMEIGLLIGDKIL